MTQETESSESRAGKKKWESWSSPGGPDAQPLFLAADWREAGAGIRDSISHLVSPCNLWTKKLVAGVRGKG